MVHTHARTQTPRPHLDLKYPYISASCWHTPTYRNKTWLAAPSLAFNHGKHLTVRVFGMACDAIMTNLAEIKGGKSRWICAGRHLSKVLIWTGGNVPHHFLIRVAFWLTSFDCWATYSLQSFSAVLFPNFPGEPSLFQLPCPGSCEQPKEM